MPIKARILEEVREQEGACVTRRVRTALVTSFLAVHATSVPEPVGSCIVGGSAAGKDRDIGPEGTISRRRLKHPSPRPKSNEAS